MKRFIYPALTLAAFGTMFTSCNEDVATQPVAAVTVDANQLEVNQSLTLRFTGSADNVVVYPGDANHNYELRNEANTGLVVNKGLLTYAYTVPGTYHVVCVATNHENAGKSLLSDTTSVWVTVTDNVNSIKDITVSVLNINEVYALPINETDWCLPLPRKVRYNKKDVPASMNNQRITIYQDSPSATVVVKESGTPDEDFKPNLSSSKYNLAKVFDIRSTAGSGGVRNYRLYTLYYGEFKTFKLGGVTAALERNEYSYNSSVINVELPSGTDLKALVPEFTLNAPQYEKVFVDGKEYQTGTPVDFTSPVKFRFTASHAENPAVTVESECTVTATVK